MALYRIYIDEVGNDGMKREKIIFPNDRYLSLTGVILENNYYKNIFYPRLFEFKSTYIPGYPDDPLGTSYCLHRKDILHRQNGFEFLNNDEARAKFDDDLLSIVMETDFTAISVVIDKLAHLDTYHSFQKHPYYYCLAIIVERYVRFLEKIEAKGDVMIEARNKNKDRELKNNFEEFFRNGTEFISSTRIQKIFTSKTIKIKPKTKNIYGLQLADVVAYPSYVGMKSQKLKTDAPANYGGKIFKILSDEKYYRA
ncbi:MAG: DUF3800 domain-containing protein, partial [Spirochaetes bacterium]|nr:DUF3800 domain-containing protein [Spirochaetota bacterium]